MLTSSNTNCNTVKCNTKLWIISCDAASLQYWSIVSNSTCSATMLVSGYHPPPPHPPLVWATQLACKLHKFMAGQAYNCNKYHEKGCVCVGEGRGERDNWFLLYIFNAQSLNQHGYHQDNWWNSGTVKVSIKLRSQFFGLKPSVYQFTSIRQVIQWQYIIPQNFCGLESGQWCFLVRLVQRLGKCPQLRVPTTIQRVCSS